PAPSSHASLRVSAERPGSKVAMPSASPAAHNSCRMISRPVLAGCAAALTGAGSWVAASNESSPKGWEEDAECGFPCQGQPTARRRDLPEHNVKHEHRSNNHE